MHLVGNLAKINRENLKMCLVLLSYLVVWHIYPTEKSVSDLGILESWMMPCGPVRSLRLTASRTCTLDEIKVESQKVLVRTWNHYGRLK
jgi:hypothetical protein